MWSNWGAWDTCTVTCGGGTNSRNRTCDNPAPSYGGATCDGESSDDDDCATDPCPGIHSKLFYT